MNFLKTSSTNPDTSSIPQAQQPDFKNAQAMEDHSPTDRRMSDDPFASQREEGFKYDMFNTERPDGMTETSMMQRDRRMSKEWDASKVPPSRFQKREGSIHATPASRDGHIDRNKLKDFAEKYNKGKKGERRKSQS